MSAYSLAWLVVLLPGIAAGLSYITESPRRAAQICIAGSFAGFVLSVVVVVYRAAHLSQNPYESVITFWTYNPGEQPQGLINDFHPQVGVLVDGLSAAVIPVVALVGLLVQVYSTAYMRNDSGYRRYFVLIALSTFFMEGLVLSPNLFDTYLMWEGVGVCGYLLIGHWWQRPAAAAAARKAFLVTRIADLGLLLGIVVNFVKLAPGVQLLRPVPGQDVNDPFDFNLLALQWNRVHAGLVSGVGTRTLVVVAVLVLVGAVGRAAQLPLHVWLPDSMEGPTPVAALLHGAAMVAAGVYLVARTYPLFLYAPHVLTVVAMVGAATAVFGAACALAQRDVKRLLAYSTISHLGLMFTALGVGAFSAAILHLVTHAWFKPLLLLAAGNLILAYRTQDILEMGGAWRRMRRTSLALLAGCASAAGVVLFAGFWSQGSILAGVLRNRFPDGGHVSASAQALLLVAVGVATVLGAIYPFRLFFLVTGGEPLRRRGFNAERIREAPRAMLYPVVSLAVLATLGGFVGVEGARYGFSKLVYAGLAPPPQSDAAAGLCLGGALALLGVALAWLLYARRLPAALGAVRRLGGVGGLAAAGLHLDAGFGWAGRTAVALARLPPRLDAGVADAVAEGGAEAAGLLGGGGRRLQPRRLQGMSAGAIAGLFLVAGGITLAATGHLPGVGGAR